MIFLKFLLDDAKSYDDDFFGKFYRCNFQLKSSGNARYAGCKMKPNRFEKILLLLFVFVSSGPMDNIPKYIDVKEGREKPDYLHPKLKPILEETYGIMVYQEQVMQATHRFYPVYTLGGADLLVAIWVKNCGRNG